MGPNDPIDPINEPLTTRQGFHRRYWTYTNRPYTGCGCLWVIIVLLIIWWIISWGYGGGYGGRGGWVW
ncbi:MAG: hypothetical protein ACRD4O_05385 [Bryobacteraceae bacterium]